MSNVLYRYHSLTAAKLLRRYKRFLADVVLANDSSTKETTIHCPNTGSMIGLGLDTEPEVLMSHHESKTRKYPYTLEAIKLGSSYVGCHSALANKLVESALRQGRLDEALGGPFSVIQPEVKHGSSRFDFLLNIAKSTQRKVFLEAKCVTLAEDSVALFPDTVSDRALKHVTELMALSTDINSGYDAAMLFVVMRNDCLRFSPSWRLDPTYARALKLAAESGVKVIAMVVELAKTDGSEEFVWNYISMMDVDLEYQREEFENKPTPSAGGKKRKSSKASD